MSTNPYWKPLVEDWKPLPWRAKHILAKEFLGHDGSLCGETVLDSEHLPFLRGVLAATTEKQIRDAASKLIRGIEEYGAIVFKTDG